jgi:hypothetical protein
VTAPNPSDEPRRSRFWRGVLTIAVLGMVAMWVYVLYLAFGPGRAPSPDRLEDPAFATAAQARCREALDVVAELPAAQDTATAAERADVLDEANESFEDMLDDLTELGARIPPGEDREIVSEWLADWRIYVDDRRDFADALRTDERSRLLVTAKGGQQITDYINEFAKDNQMPACGSPIDA